MHAWVPCSTGLAMFASVKQVCTDSRATLLSQGQNNHAPSPQYVRSNPCTSAALKARSQQLLAVQMANTGASTVDGDTEQLFQASGPRTMHSMCSCACTKGFQLSTCTSQAV